MSRILNVAGMAAVGMTAASMLLLAEPGFASDLAADANIPTIILPGADAPVVGIRLGTLDGDPGIRPQWHQWLDSAPDWEPIPDDGLPRFSGARR